jgi:methionyl-tRNA formyltransferase
VAAYGLILPPRILDATPAGAINIHASLLPRWRGAAPIQRALLAGDRETGITIMKMDAGLDTGPILAQRRIEIAADDDAGTLHDRLAALGAGMIVAVLADIAAGRARTVPQPEAGASYARKLEKRETEIDWSRPSEELERAVRALRPAPGAQSVLRGTVVKLWRALRRAAQGAPGEVLDAGPQGILVACGEGALEVSELQRAGGRRLAAGEFLRGFPIGRGARFGAAR